jgi:E3 ubiquitin-protein ligase BRE1
VSSKVFELKDTELKIARLQTEKAKADNKYFQAMRSKEGKLAQRTVEKQLKLLERAQEVERSLNAQIVSRRAPGTCGTLLTYCPVRIRESPHERQE